MMLNSKSKNLVLTVFIFLVLLTSTHPVEAKKNVLTVPGDYPTIQAAVDDANPGDTIKVGPGEWVGAIIDKPVTLVGEPGAIIVDGEYIYGYYEGAEIVGFWITPEGAGSTIRSFTFKGGPIGDTDRVLHFAVFARGTDSITVTMNNIVDCVQCITNNGGDNWVITFNKIHIISPYGTAIFVTNSEGTTNGNLIAFNSIETNNPYSPVSFSQRWGEYISTNNRIVANKITNPSGKGISLLYCVPNLFFNNIIALNDLRECATPLEIPLGIIEVNTIRMNLT